MLKIAEDLGFDACFEEQRLMVGFLPRLMGPAWLALLLAEWCSSNSGVLPVLSTLVAEMTVMLRDCVECELDCDVRGHKTSCKFQQLNSQITSTQCSNSLQQ